ncbi:RNA ligase [Nonomuraea wenchangensis]
MLTTALHLHDLIDPDDLLAEIHAGYVHEQTHPTLPLKILNYTNKTQAEREWNAVTKQCRGLIVDSRTGEIIARPWAKFFTYGDPNADVIDMSAPADVIDKVDGSLGILHPTPDGWAVATRGSFTSPQAIHATRLLRARYGEFEPPSGMTVLVEIVYPGNRIVCDYDGVDDLFLLGAVDIATGYAVGPDWVSGWPGPSATVFQARTLAEALAMPPRPGAEGLVVRMLDTGHLVKIKQDDYLALHAVLTRTSARTLWEYLAVNACQHLITHPNKWGSLLRLDPRRAERCLAVGPNWLERVLDNVPDEFHAWVMATIADLTGNVAALAREVDDYADLARYVYGDDRKAMAAEVSGHPEYGLVFKRISGDDITAQLWVRFYPDADRPWLVQEEATA